MKNEQIAENGPIQIFIKLTDFISGSITIKLIIITILMLLLLIPTSMIQSIIHEREKMNQEAIFEVNSKWAEDQQINGPVLTIPLIYEKMVDDKLESSTKNLYILPERLNISAKVDPEKLKRGIYEVVVYKSDIDLSGNFDLNQKIDTTDIKRIAYEAAFLTIGISDLRGIKNEIKLNWGEHALKVEPGSRIPDLIYSGITVDLPQLNDSSKKTWDFDFKLKLQGSKNLSFIPLGGNTDVKVQSTWNSPSFNGKFLPDHREVNKDGFEAHWKVLQLNKSFPQSWVSGDQKERIASSAFGFDLILPIDDYQKSMRSVKYAVMTIALTFLIFFLVEIMNKRKIHPFQYALVGLALCLFYILLVAISEHSNFNLAFGISTLSIVGMIGLYSLSVFKKMKFTLLLVAVLLGLYAFLFVTMQLTDYALLMGSAGLVLILGATMYFTRNINWYQLNLEK